MIKDITGSRVGHIEAVRFSRRVRSGDSGKTYWIFRCDCGVEFERWAGAVGKRSSTYASCGCKLIEKNKTHGRSSRKGQRPDLTYQAWLGAKRRCFSQTGSHYPRWGGRGITMCERWSESFENFLADMGEKPEGLSLERVDNDGPYSPENCKWATTKQQNRNRRTTRQVVIDGAPIPRAQAAEQAGLPARLLEERLRRGWSLERALSQPVRRTSATKAGTKDAA